MPRLSSVKDKTVNYGSRLVHGLHNAFAYQLTHFVAHALKQKFNPNRIEEGRLLLVGCVDEIVGRQFL